MRSAFVFVVLALACGDDDVVDVDSGAGSPDATTMRDASPPREDAGTPPPACPATASLPALGAEDIVPGESFNEPVFVTSAPGDPDTLYVVEKRGRIVVVQGGEKLEDPFFEVTDILSDGEEGLLGLAFHPDYESNGRFFVYYTPARPRRNVVAEHRRSAADPLRSDPEVARLMELDDSEGNHNGGMIAFGPDGYLYVGTGDEGGGGDEHGAFGNALNRENLFGSMLRLDVEAPERDFAPTDNPFSDGMPQIWGYGLRNPWRFSFDRATGDLYVADVGQGAFEEVSIVPAGHSGGANFGWRAYEGFSVYDEAVVDRVPDHHEPAMVYAHDSASEPMRFGCSITGGYVYRGPVTELHGWYFYGDYCSLDIAAFRYCDEEVRDHQRVDELRAGGDGSGNGLSSFGEDGRGHVYLVYAGSGHVRRIVSP